MKIQQIKIALTAVWMLAAMMILVGSVHLTSMIDRIGLAIFGVLPPLALLYWWNEPVQTLSESIHRVRDEGRSARTPAAAE